jgi:hypothetical protein
MGALTDWLLVLCVAIFLGAYKPLRLIVSGRKFRDENFWAAADLIPSVFFGFFLGIMIAFHWRAFRWPLILITLAAFLAATIAGSSRLKSGDAN